MNKLILCEGKTDAVLLGYYLETVADWKKSENSPKGLDIRSDDCHHSKRWFQKNDDYLLICSVGGNTQFKNFFETKIKPPQKKKDAFEKIAIVIDRDNHEIRELENEADSVVKSLSTKAKLQNRKWVDCHYENRFNEEKSFQVLLVAIPQKGQGALETLMLKAIAENDRSIVDKTGNFIRRMRKEEPGYITNDSLELKAHWGLTWAILCPQTIFMPFEEQIKKVPWEKFNTFQNCFSELIKI